MAVPRPSADRPGLGLRPEARPFSWEALTASQQDTFLRIVRVLRAAIEQLDENERKLAEPAVRGLPPRLQPQHRRNNPAVLVSGARGIGKTSLLLTLQQEMLTNPRKDIDLGELGKRVVWLETLDLEPLPPTTRLMAAIMARFEQVVNEDAATHELYAGRPDSDFEKAHRALTDLSLDSCLAWDRDYPRLGGSTDTDHHARELFRVEKARTNLLPRFAQVLTNLARHTRWLGGQKDPLFVLPVDDVDLNPRRCLEVLRLIRSLLTPRLVVVLLGDYEVAREVVTRLAHCPK